TALTWFSQAITILEPVLAREPRHRYTRSSLAVAYAQRAKTLTRLDRYIEGLKDWDRAIELADELKHSSLRLGRAATLAHLKEYARATAEAQDLARTPNASQDTLYAAGCAYALSVTAARQDAKLPALERDKLAERFASSAVELLRQAVAK